MVLTGALMSMTRQLAWEALAGVGAVPAKGVSKKTNVLVIGEMALLR